MNDGDTRADAPMPESIRAHGKRWALKHEGRTFIVHQTTREAAIELFGKEMSEVFRLLAPPSRADIEAGVHELGPQDLADGKVLVDKNPARETRQGQTPEVPKATEPAVPLTALEQIQNGAKSVP